MGPAAYLGIEGSYSHLAAVEHFGKAAELNGYKRFGDIFQAVTEGDAECGIIPLENTLAGTITENYFLLGENNLFIIAENGLRIQHSLLTLRPDVSLNDIRIVLSHEKALDQCSRFFKEHDWITPKKHDDTADAAKQVFEDDDPEVAAIASSAAGSLYGLHAIKVGLEDNTSNYTRFGVIARQLVTSEAAKKCSILVEMPHLTGSLYTFIGTLAVNKDNLTNILCRPIQGRPFEYNFYVDFIAGDEPGALDKTLASLTEVVTQLKVLGIYKSWLADGHSIEACS